MSITRRQFFAQLKKRGFSKSRLQLARTTLTYERELDRIFVTVPKHHSNTFHILGGTGDIPRGFFVRSKNPPVLGIQLPMELCPLQLCLDVLDGNLEVGNV
jgi:hypothetical protein